MSSFFQPLYNEHRVSLLGVKRPGLALTTHPDIAPRLNMSYTSTPPTVPPLTCYGATFLLCSSLLVLDLSDFSIPLFHIYVSEYTKAKLSPALQGQTLLLSHCFSH